VAKVFTQDLHTAITGEKTAKTKNIYKEEKKGGRGVWKKVEALAKKKAIKVRGGI